MRPRSVAVVAALPLALVSLAGCGNSESAADYAKTAASTIEQNGRDALHALKSVHLSVDMASSGTATSSQPTKMVMSLDTSGNCTGTVASQGYTIGVISVSGAAYMKASGAFWTSHGAPAADLSKVADKWVTAPSTSFGSACDLAALTKQFVGNLDPAADHPKVLGTGTVNGVSVVNLQVTTSKGATNTISIDAKSPHSVIQVKSSDGKELATFSAINQPINATAPAGAVDGQTLQ